MAQDDWPVLLRVSTSTRVSRAPDGDSGELWFCGTSSEPRRLDRSAAVWCLPLLERPRADVDEELERARAHMAGATAAALDGLVPGGLVTAALLAESSYWMGLACGWLADLAPSEECATLARQIEEAPAADQRTRHLARRMRRREDLGARTGLQRPRGRLA